MSLLQFDQVSFAYGTEVLLAGISFTVGEHDRLCIVGPNGTGKSTLLHLMSGALEPVEGRIARRRGLSAGYLAQDPLTVLEGTVYTAASAPFEALFAGEARRAQIEEQLAARPGDAALIAELNRLQAAWEHAQGYSLEARIRGMLSRLGFPPAAQDKPVAVLSGGELSRLGLCRLLLEPHDLLLLDEPTNHLDVHGMRELEDFIESFPGAIVSVSHDRAFLARTARRVIEIRGAAIEEYTGGYAKYLAERRERHALHNELWRRQQEEIARTEEFIRRNIAGQKSRQAKGRRTLLERLERLERIQDEPVLERLDFGEPPAANKEVIYAARLRCDIGGRTLFAAADFALYRGDKVGLAGANGSGKSTLLRMIAGEHRPSDGVLRVGNRVRLGYCDQRLEGIDNGETVLGNLRAAVEMRQEAARASAIPGQETGFAARRNLSDEALRSYAAQFLFFDDEVFQSAATLSGGERARLLLACLLLRPNNLLVLDEPTNHLDIPAREALERALRAYTGSLLIVSHDRYFLDQTTTRTWLLENQRIEVLPGPYTDAVALHAKNPGAQSPVEAQKSVRSAQYEAAKEQKRMSERRQRRIAELEAAIAEAEAAAAELTVLMQDPALARDWERLAALQKAKDAATARAAAYLDEWTEQAAAEEAYQAGAAAR